MSQIDLMPKLTTKKSSRIFKSLNRLPSLMPVPNNRNKHLALPKIITNLSPRNRNKRKPRITQLLSNQSPKYALNLMINARHPLSLHAGAILPPTASRVVRPVWLAGAGEAVNDERSHGWRERGGAQQRFSHDAKIVSGSHAPVNQTGRATREAPPPITRAPVLPLLVRSCRPR
jgi:hypothetical protein